jgi:hypothetical protein
LAEPQHAAPKPVTPRLGEELPVFCERCGYSLHGLPQTTCDHCTIRQFHCPECGHHQPINTLRPAVQHMLGRVRAMVLIGSVVLKLAFFGLMLFAWTGMGVGWSYKYNPSAGYVDDKGNYVETGPREVPVRVSDIDAERFAAFAVFGFAFGCVARMLLLRWRRGPLVGLCIATLVSLAIVLGATINYWDSLDHNYRYELPYTGGLLCLICYASLIIVTAASVVWPIWCGLVKAFLPKRAATVLLEWQRAMSDPSARAHIRAELAREPVATYSSSLKGEVG